MTLLYTALVIGVLWLVLKPYLRNFTRPAPAPVRAHVPTPVPAFEWPRRDEYECEIVGESHYQIALCALMGDGSDPEIDGEGQALLVPEDDNQHDNKAVRVDIGGVTVGYLAKEDARTYRRRLASKKLGMCVASCRAQIVGGFTTSAGETASYGVKLDIKPFE